MASSPRILLSGSTGYVGGAILDHIMKSREASLQDLTIDLLVRNSEAAERLRKVYGQRVNPIHWKGLTDTTFIVNTASEYDIVLNAGFGYAPEGAEAFVRGLARRTSPGTPTPWMLHLSGCSNLADRPLTQTAYPDREWDDEDSGALFEYLKAEDARDPYPQRTAEVRVLSAAEETGVRAISVNSPCIFGTGSGLFRRQGFIIPAFMHFVMKHGCGFKLNETANFDWVHVEDLADLFVLLLRTIIEREDRGVGYLPSGRSGIVSSSVGHTLQVDMMWKCLDAAFEAGILPKLGGPEGKEVRQFPLQFVAGEIFGTVELEDMAERSWAGHKKLNGTVGRRLIGWQPKRLDESWEQNFKDVVNTLKAGEQAGILEHFDSGYGEF